MREGHKAMPRNAVCKKCNNPFTASTRGPIKWHCPKCVTEEAELRKAYAAPPVVAKKIETYAPPKPLRNNPLTAEFEYTDEELAFLKAVDAWKKKTGKSFPTCVDFLSIAKSLGYQRIADTGYQGE